MMERLRTGQEAEAKRIQHFLSVAENVVVVNYPQSAKAFLALSCEGIGETCRVTGPPFSWNEEQRTQLSHLLCAAQELANELGIETPTLHVDREI